MHARTKAVAALISTLSLTIIPLSSQAAVSCATINKYYPNGVSASKYVKNVGGDLSGTPRVKSSVYKKYRHLDVDKDKIVCEIEIESSYDVATIAYREVRALVDGSSTASESQIIASKNLPKSYVGMLSKDLSTAMSMWDERYGVIDNYNIIAFTYLDAAWADIQHSKYTPWSVPEGSWQAWIDSYPEQGKNCWLADARANSFHICMALDKELAIEQSAGAAHEYFHSVQGKIGLTHNNTPVWLGEGSAYYFGAVAGDFGSDYIINQAGKTSTRYLSIKYKARTIKNYVFKMSEADIISLYTVLESGMTSESRDALQDYAGFNFGSLATEYLIGTYGYDTFMSLLDDIGNGTNWKTAFKNRFGMSSNDFYVTMLKYLQEVY